MKCQRCTDDAVAQVTLTTLRGRQIFAYGCLYHVTKTLDYYQPRMTELLIASILAVPLRDEHDESTTP